MASRKEKSEKKSKRTNASAWAKKQKTAFEPTSIKLPEGVEFYKLEPGTVKVDFMPYVVGEGNPHADEGMEHFEREYTAHRIPTPDGVRLYVCRKKTWNKKCAACDFLIKNSNTADPELVKQLRATTRHLWIVNDKPGNEKNKLKILDTNHYNKGLGFGELIATVINSVEEYQDFWLLDGGYTANMTITEQKFPGGKFNAVNVINFLPRKYEYSPAMLKKAPCLDELLVDPGYEEVMQLLDTSPPSDDDDSDDEDEKPDRRRAKAVDDEEEEDTDSDDDSDDDDEEEETPKRRARKSSDDEEEDEKPARNRKSKKDDEDEEDSDDEDSDDDDSDDEDEKPTRRKTSKKADSDDDDEEEEEDMDEDEEEEEDEKPRKRSKTRR